MIVVTACFGIESRRIRRRPSVRVIRTGIGERAPDALDAPAGVSHLVATGFCGGVDPSLRRGDVVLARSVRYRGGRLPIDPELLIRAERALDGGSVLAHVGAFESADHVLEPGEKRELAELGVVAVDMESGPLARWAEQRAVPFLALRVVIDPADAELPFPIDRPFWTSALRHPAVCLRTARGAFVAGRALGRAVDLVADELIGGPDA